MDLYKQFPESPLNFDERFENLLEIFTRYEITIFDLLSLNPLEISSKINRPINEINSFIAILRKETENLTVVSGDELKSDKFTTGDGKIDELLGGGIRTGMITEIFGESSTAKSQFCMQLTKTVQLDKDQGGLEGNAVYISTEGNLETKRLIEISPKIENVFYINCTDLETQEHILNVQLPILLKDPKKNIKLVIIDSISHHLRVELLSKTYDGFLQNQKYVDQIVLYLNNLAIDNEIAIAVTNQISDKPNTNILNTDYKKITYDYQIGWLSGWSSQDIRSRQDNEESNNKSIATLGLNWTNNIGVRILLKKNYKPGYNNNNQIQQGQELNSNGWIMKRSMKLVFSPFVNMNELEFRVVSKGLISM